MIRIRKVKINLSKKDFLTTLNLFKQIITMVILNFSISHKTATLIITPIITLKSTSLLTSMNQMIHPISIPSLKINLIKIPLNQSTTRNNNLFNLGFSFSLKISNRLINNINWLKIHLFYLLPPTIQQIPYSTYLLPHLINQINPVFHLSIYKKSIIIQWRRYNRLQVEFK